MHQHGCHHQLQQAYGNLCSWLYSMTLAYTGVSECHRWRGVAERQCSCCAPKHKPMGPVPLICMAASHVTRCSAAVLQFERQQFSWGSLMLWYEQGSARHDAASHVTGFPAAAACMPCSHLTAVLTAFIA